MLKTISLTIGILGLIFVVGCADKQPERQDVTLQSAQASATLPLRLQQSVDALKNGNAKYADKLLSKWIFNNPDSHFMDRALFLRGNAKFQLKQYYSAYLLYDKMLENYSASANFEAAVRQELLIGKLFVSGTKRKLFFLIPIGARGDGLDILDKVASYWAGSELAAEALLAQAEYFFSIGRFNEAQETYQLLLDSYPRIKNRQEIMLRSAESTHAQYTTSEYDTNCLKNAKVRYQQLQILYPEFAEKHDVKTRIQRIQWQQAMQMYDTAEFYQRTKRPEAAKHYWTLIEKQYPDTEWANLSNAMLEKYN